jgi:hypothetical protein
MDNVATEIGPDTGPRQNAMTPLQRVNAQNDPISALRIACEEVAKTQPGDVQTIASLHTGMILDYYRDVRRQAQQSFIAALVAASIGTLFFLYALWPMAHAEGGTASRVGLIAGGLIQVISAINFYLYSRASRQFAVFHICLERTNRFLLANSLCENLVCKDYKDKTRMELIDLIAKAPMLTVEMMTPARDQKAPRVPRVRLKVGAGKAQTGVPKP